MLKRIFVLMAILLAGCIDEEDRTIQPLTLSKIPYTGNELKADGYYYAVSSYIAGASGEKIVTADAIVLYRDGVCMQIASELTNQDTFGLIENGIFGDKELMLRSWSTPTNIGTFHVNNDSLKFDIWSNSTYGNIITLSYFGKILNDTTFVKTKLINRSIRKTFPENLTYRFKQFSPKPDSTNTFIK